MLKKISLLAFFIAILQCQALENVESAGSWYTGASIEFVNSRNYKLKFLEYKRMFQSK